MRTALSFGLGRGWVGGDWRVVPRLMAVAVPGSGHPVATGRGVASKTFKGWQLTRLNEYASVRTDKRCRCPQVDHAAEERRLPPRRGGNR